MADRFLGTGVIAIIPAGVIGLALLVAGAPLIVPLMVIVFVAGFVPVVGCMVATLVVVSVTLAAAGFVKALIVLVAVGVFYFIEATVLVPVIVGRTVSLNPLATLLVVAVGRALGGPIGAFLAIPIASIGIAMAKQMTNPSAVED